MNEILNFFHDIFVNNDKNTCPIGLTSLKETNVPISNLEKKKNKKEEINISELLRRHQ